jgi:phenylacetate-CoA ligase
LIDAVDAVRPTYLQVQPTTLKLMVAHDHKRVLANLRLAAVFSYGEQFERESKDQVEAHLGCRVLDLFGTSECGYIAGSCPHCGGLHVHAEVALVETVAEDGSQAKPGETGRLLITPFYSYVMPLIRYDHADFAQVASDGCQITLPAFAEIFGKMRVPFVFPGGRTIQPYVPTGWVIDRLGAQTFQVAQVAPDRCEYSLVPGSLAPSQMNFDE